jgi:hypothetical protein
MEITVTSENLTINGHRWESAPSIDDLCQAVGSENWKDGDFIVIQGKPVSKFRYFDELGIGIIETIPDKRVERVSINMQTPPRKRERKSPYGNTGARSTTGIFGGHLHLNNKMIQSPIKFSQFPIKGDLLFVHRIAIGKRLSVSVSQYSGFVDRIRIGFKAENEKT